MLLLPFVVNVVVFFSRRLFNGRARCNEAWHYLIQLSSWLCNDFVNLKHLFLIIFVVNVSQKTVKSKI